MSKLLKFSFSTNKPSSTVKRKGTEKSKQGYEKSKSKHGFYPKWRDDFPWLDYDEDKKCHVLQGHKDSAMSLNAAQYGAVHDVLGETDASKFGNRADVEYQWAMKAYHHAETYDNLLRSVDAKFLKLTQLDDEIYTEFRKDFPNLKIDVLDEDAMKTPESKAEWREFFKKFEKRVEDYNMGTLIRINSADEFSEENSTIVVRLQFLAIEIARNREGYNDGRKKQPQEETKSSSS